MSESDDGSDDRYTREKNNCKSKEAILTYLPPFKQSFIVLSYHS